MRNSSLSLRSPVMAGAWLDTAAVGISVICAIHCLVTPVLLVLLPVLSQTVWVHQDFHLWVLLLALPVAGVALYLGCRKHRDKLVGLLGITGIALMCAVVIYESLNAAAGCAHCESGAVTGYLEPMILMNVVGGMLLAGSHVRNFLLCRKRRCTECCS